LSDHREFNDPHLRAVARRATALKWGFFVGAGAARPNEKSLVELTVITMIWEELTRHKSLV